MCPGRLILVGSTLVGEMGGLNGSYGGLSGVGARQTAAFPPRKLRLREFLAPSVEVLVCSLGTGAQIVEY